MIEYLVAALAVLSAAVAMGVRTVRRRFAVVAVSGASMQPTLSSGDRVLIRRAIIGELRTGQIVVIETPRPAAAASIHVPHWPPTPDGGLIKRIAATAGEPAPVAMVTGSTVPAEPVVPAGKLAVLGDNLGSSLDSRHIGYVPADRVLGIMIRSLPTGDRRSSRRPGRELAERLPDHGSTAFIPVSSLAPTRHGAG